MLSNHLPKKKKHVTLSHQDVSSAFQESEGENAIEALEAYKVSRNS